MASVVNERDVPADGRRALFRRVGTEVNGGTRRIERADLVDLRPALRKRHVPQAAAHGVAQLRVGDLVELIHGRIDLSVLPGFPAHGDDGALLQDGYLGSPNAAMASGESVGELFRPRFSSA